MEIFNFIMFYAGRLARDGYFDKAGESVRFTLKNQSRSFKQIRIGLAELLEEHLNESIEKIGKSRIYIGSTVINITILKPNFGSNKSPHKQVMITCGEIL